MLAAILICGTTVFTACSSGDDDVKEPPVQPEQPEDDGANSGTEGEFTYIPHAGSTSAVMSSLRPATTQAIRPRRAFIVSTNNRPVANEKKR